jgi:thioredoxin reductase (NADPH)
MRNVVIIGSGPAGYTAAIYAARANLNPLLIEGLQIGGQLSITTDVENFPGFPEGIMGPDLMEAMKKQAARFGTDFLAALVTKVDFSQRPFRLYTDDEEVQAKSVIICSGAFCGLLVLKRRRSSSDTGLDFATCDGYFFRGKEIMVIGGGDSALEEATLTKFANKVTVAHRRDKLRAKDHAGQSL